MGLMKFLSIFIGVKINLVLWKIYDFKSEQKSSQVHRLELQNNLGSRVVMWLKGGGGGGKWDCWFFFQCFKECNSFQYVKWSS